MFNFNTIYKLINYTQIIYFRVLKFNVNVLINRVMRNNKFVLKLLLNGIIDQTLKF